jgi:ABC-type lipoprotein export system ATPase subunit
VTGPAARAVQVWKVYGAGETEVVALRDVSVELARGKFTAIMGPSGSGKSTLMHCLAGLDSVSRGEVYVGDTRVTGLGDAGLTRLRRDKIGFIFQQFNLLPTLTAEENILLPLSIAGRKPDPEWYRTVIETVRLGDRLGHRPSQLSGGQQQRVACARALVGRPDVIFADEPTGNLDSRSGADVLSFLRDSVRTHGQTIVMVTHDPVAASYADRVLFLADGAVVDEILEPTAAAVLDRMHTIDALDQGRRGAAEFGGSAPESRGTIDPTGRTPHPGPQTIDGGGPATRGRKPEPGGGGAGPRDPGDQTARLTATGAAHAVRVFAADNAPATTMTSTAPSTLAAMPQQAPPGKPTTTKTATRSEAPTSTPGAAPPDTPHPTSTGVAEPGEPRVPDPATPDTTGQPTSGTATTPGDGAEAVGGGTERRGATRRRAAAQRPATTRPPKGRRTGSAPAPSQDGADTAPTDAAAGQRSETAKPRKATRARKATERTPPPAAKRTDAPPDGGASGSIVDEHS